MPNWKKLITSGSDASLASLVATNEVSASNLHVSSTGSIEYLTVNDELKLGGPGSQFFAYNEDTIKVKFANWYSSNDRQYGMGQLWFETWFAAIDNQALRDNRRIGFYLEEPDAGSTDSGTPGQHPSNARFYVDIDGAYLSGSLNVENAVSASAFSGSFFGDGSGLTGLSAGIFAKTGSSQNTTNNLEITGSLLTTGGASGSFSGSFFGDGSGLTGISSTVVETATVTDTFTNTTSKTVTHNFGTRNILVSVYDNSYNQIIPGTVTLTDTNTVDITFPVNETGTVVVAKGGHIVSGSSTNALSLNGQPGSYYLNYSNFTNAPVSGDFVGTTDTQTLTNKTINMGDNLLTRPLVKDYAMEVYAHGSITTATTIDLENGNVHTATIGGNLTLTFSNPIASGDATSFVLELTNGGAYTLTFPAAVDWEGGTAPTLTAAGVDILVFYTRDGGTTWHGIVSSLDSK